MTTTVFVHGNPMTAAVWEGLLVELGRDDVRLLSPPGFGAPLPGGFDVSPDGYRDWLVGELECLDGPVDLVGHDWGGAHVVRVAMDRPDLLRSWVSDAVGVFHPDYAWHELAVTWQTPGAGERQLAGLADRDAWAARLAGRGMPLAVAERVIDGYDPSMAHAILALYRAAAQPAMARAGRRLERAAARPGLAVLATGDPVVGTLAQRREAAARAGAQVAVLEGVGHWWPARYPVRTAQVLRRFWASLDTVTTTVGAPAVRSRSVRAVPGGSSTARWRSPVRSGRTPWPARVPGSTRTPVAP
ncbi:pimeloyl-ACP methyl ester carboxylesterase [Actinomycetospora corticicola]|uniref:Pimeloyl-ACP methyl ester carboxylesterase n=1 Tax=Actinomycetospora corticicola TaxID=663602 RepID=A0A7Y9DW24_9PSEU|nr:pimeloyl-ACP methyl ester carboxylesterase [Actinomycetospora corticicola]